MFDLGFSELVIFGVIALIVLGPEKLPKTMRTLGTYYAKFRRTVSTLQAEMESELDLAETRQKMQQELAKIKQAELDMQKEMAQMRQNMRQFEQSQDKQLADKDKATKTVKISKSEESIPVPPNPVLPNPVLPTDKEAMEQKTVDNDMSPSELEDTLFQARLQLNHPWENMWFRLGAYDKARRLPAPPLLPNYSSDSLLNVATIPDATPQRLSSPKPLSNQTDEKGS